MLLCLFPGVLWLWHFLYSVGPHPVPSLHIYTFVMSRAFMAGAASQAGDADSSRAPGLTSGLQGSVNVYRGALLLVPQWQCIRSFEFYIDVIQTNLDLCHVRHVLHEFLLPFSQIIFSKTSSATFRYIDLKFIIMYLSRHSTDHVRLLSHLISFYMRYCPLLKFSLKYFPRRCLRYWLIIWYMDLSWGNADHVWFWSS